MNFDLRVLDVRGKGVLCTASSDTGDSYWLPRGEHVEWSNIPHPGTYVSAEVPSWLANKHRQLVGEVAFKSTKQSNLGKVNSMTERPEDAGKGVLFRNDRKERENQPDYRGDITIRGTKYQLAAWIKEGQKGKFMSLSARPVDDRGDDRNQPAKRNGQRPLDRDDIPF